MTNLCIRWERIANEILMYFRSMKKTAGDVSLSDCIETGKDGNALSLMDVLCSDEDLFEDLSTRQTYKKLYEVMDEVLSERERMVVTLRYGLGDRTPLTQREIAAKCGISRSYVSRIEKKSACRASESASGLHAGSMKIPAAQPEGQLPSVMRALPLLFADGF